MANANVNRLGIVNQEGDARALFLKIFSGEVLTSFERHNILLPLTNVRTITEGKSASFPLVGKIGAEYHQVGTEITGLNVNHAERIITIDDLLISHAFVADIDEAMNHYDVRSIYSTEMGRKLATQMDTNIFKEIINSARSESLLADEDAVGGIEIKSDKFKMGSDGGATTLKEQTEALASAIFTMAQTLDENDIPEEGRYVAFRPEHYYVLAQNLDLINSLYGGTGAISEGNIVKVAGITVLKSNNVPKTNDESDPYHTVDASKTIGVGFLRDAVGTVKLMDLSMQMEWDIRRQGTLMVARYAVGHAPLRPECAVEFKLDNLSN